MLIAVCACVVAGGLATGGVREAAPVAVVPSPAPGASGACGAPSLVAGAGAADGARVEAFTNALVAVPGCGSDRTMLLSGSSVRGVGPAVSVTYTLAAAETSAWYGLVGPEGVALLLPAGAGALVSFTNDLASGSEDRNLRLEVTPR